MACYKPNIATAHNPPQVATTFFRFFFFFGFFKVQFFICRTFDTKFQRISEPFVEKCLG